MKAATALALVTTCVMELGCQSSPVVPQASITTAGSTEQGPALASPKPPIATGYDWRGDWTRTDFRIVELEQGTLAADTLDVCHASWVAPSGLSNRRKDECDRIAAKGMKLQLRQEAEEKRKDEAYDKAHNLQPAR